MLIIIMTITGKTRISRSQGGKLSSALSQEPIIEINDDVGSASFISGSATNLANCCSDSHVIDNTNNVATSNHTDSAVDNQSNNNTNGCNNTNQLLHQCNTIHAVDESVCAVCTKIFKNDE